MATWGADAAMTHPLDFRLVHDTSITMFWQPALLDDTAGWLESRGYQVVEFDTASWNTNDDLYDEVARAFRFPEHAGRDTDALNDCMSDVASGDHGWDADATGLVIVLRAFDAFASLDPRTAQALLDIVARQARNAMLIGNRIICLVQSDDPHLSFDPVGATPVTWNEAEWPSSKRGPGAD